MAQGEIKVAIVKAVFRRRFLCFGPTRYLKCELSSGLMVEVSKPDVDLWPQRLKIRKLPGRMPLTRYDVAKGIYLPWDEKSWDAFLAAMHSGARNANRGNHWRVVGNGDLIVGSGEFDFALSRDELRKIEGIVDRFPSLEFKE